jgi:hypothetical protein
MVHREGADEHDLLGALADVDETAGACQLGPEPTDVEVAVAVGLRQPQFGAIQGAPKWSIIGGSSRGASSNAAKIYSNDGTLGPIPAGFGPVRLSGGGYGVLIWRT